MWVNYKICTCFAREILYVNRSGGGSSTICTIITSCMIGLLNVDTKRTFSINLFVKKSKCGNKLEEISAPPLNCLRPHENVHCIHVC